MRGLNLVRSWVPRARHCSLRAKYMMFSPAFISAAPPVGSSNTWAASLVQVIAYFSSVSAEFSKPPVLPMNLGS